MKRLLTTTLLGLASVAFLASSANAQLSNAGDYDVVLGFIATSGTGSGVNVEVDLGSINQFIDATPGEVIQLNSSTQLEVADLNGAKIRRI